MLDEVLTARIAAAKRPPASEGGGTSADLSSGVSSSRRARTIRGRNRTYAYSDLDALIEDSAPRSTVGQSTPTGPTIRWC